MPRKKSGAQLLQQWLKKDIIRPGTRVRVLKGEAGLWPVLVTATIIEVENEGEYLSDPWLGFKPDDPCPKPTGMNGLWWVKYEWVEILHPKDDPLNTEQVTPSQEVMTG